MGKKNHTLTTEDGQQIQIVDALQVENNRLKDTLSEILKEELQPDELNLVEYFQTLLVNKDIALSLLRYELSFPSNNTSLQQLQKDLGVMADGISSMRAALHAFRTTIRNGAKKEIDY